MEVKEPEKKEEYRLTDEIQKLFDERHNRRITESYRNSMPGMIRAGMITGALVMILLYFIMPSSKVSYVSVRGNDYLKSEDIKELSGITENSIYFLSLPPIIESRIKESPLIEDAHVSLDENNVITVEVTEKKIAGYRYEDVPVLLFTDNTKCELQSEFLYIISRVPLITGFTEEEQTRLLTKAFDGLDKTIVEDMAEVSQYALKYDDEAILILMRNGMYIISDYTSMDILNRYNEVYSLLTNKEQCIVTSSHTITSKACPWDEGTEAETVIQLEPEESAVPEESPVPDESESPKPDVDPDVYWLDADGNPVLNEAGEMIEKHYYTLEDGSRPLDSNGKAIPIPIDENGNEVYDDNFEFNYRSGFYRFGILILPNEFE